MKHINKQLGVNVNFLEQGNHGRDRKAITEGINIMILILLGCGGLYVYSNITSPKKAVLPFTNITTNAALSVAEKQKTAPVMDEGTAKN